MDDDTLVIFGDEVKALGGGKVGGHLVLFGSSETPDISIHKDYFTKSTDFWHDFGGPVKSPVLYHHGLDPTLKRRRIGVAELKMDDAGIWAEAQLKLADDYEKKVLAMVEAGKLRWSSGSAAHLVERKDVGEGVHEVVSWPLGIEASLTPTPAEPRTMAVSLKSLIDTPSGPAPGRTLDDHSLSVLAAVSELTERLEGYASLKASDGRSVPASRREQFRAFHDRLGALLGRMEPRADPVEWRREYLRHQQARTRLAREGVI